MGFVVLMHSKSLTTCVTTVGEGCGSLLRLRLEENYDNKCLAKIFLNMNSQDQRKCRKNRNRDES